ncbi:MAG: hypothetical protein ACRERE_04685 [Candidatus Entotheonellia bacterium]
MPPEHLTPVPDDGHGEEPVSDLNLYDQLPSLLRQARAVAEVTKWTPLEAFENPNNEALLCNALDMVVEQLDAALALLERWRAGRFM